MPLNKTEYEMLQNALFVKQTKKLVLSQIKYQERGRKNNTKYRRHKGDVKFVVVEVFKRIGENGSRAPPIPKLGINGGEWSASRCGRFNTRKRATLII